MSEQEEIAKDKEEVSKGRDVTEKIAIVLVVVLLGFAAFVFFRQPETAVLDNYQYSNGDSIFEVNKVSDIETYIHLTVGNDEIPYVLALRNDPLSLENIPITGNFAKRVYDDEEVYLTIHPRANLTGRTTIAALEIDKIIDNKYFYNVPVYSAMTEPLGDYPVKTCSDATSDSTVIWLTLGSETSVYADGNCIIVVGKDEDELIRAADRLVLTMLGIMQ